MNDQLQTYEAFGGVEAYRDIHEALSRALAEPSAQGDHAHGARAGFLLTQIAPQIQRLRKIVTSQALEDAGVPLELRSMIAPYLVTGTSVIDGNSGERVSGKDLVNTLIRVTVEKDRESTLPHPSELLEWEDELAATGATLRQMEQVAEWEAYHYGGTKIYKSRVLKSIHTLISTGEIPPRQTFR